MPSYLQTIKTAVPEFQYDQDELRDMMKEIVEGSERDRRVLHQVYSRSGIQTRHSVVNDFRKTDFPQLFFNGQGARPGTKNRNDTYIKQGRKLFVDAAQQVVNSSDIARENITHLITVSCTGFYAPGPDYDIIRALGLPPSIERYHLGFMGCYAVIPALKMADQLCRANPKANVLIVSAELCTLHFQADSKTDSMISASVFADGAAGALVNSRKPSESPAFQIDSFASVITDEGAEDMAWSIGDQGFDMVLSSYVPQLLSESLDPFLSPLFERLNLSKDEIDLWGIHPGGRAILDSVENKLNLPDQALSASRKILSDYGNMSSATILFVLKQLLETKESATLKKTLAMAFGPGLTIESALLTKVT